MLSRREILHGFPKIALVSAANSVLTSKAEAQSKSSALSPAVLDSVNTGLGWSLAKIHQGTVVESDLHNASLLIGLLAEHFAEIEFDKSFNILISKFNFDSVQQSDMDEFVRRTYIELKKLDGAITQAFVAGFFNLNGDTLQQNLLALRQQGLVSHLRLLSSKLATVATSTAISYYSGARLERTNTCGVATFYVGAFSTAAFTLSFGCLSPPTFLVICPAVAALGTIAGFTSAITWWLC